MTNWADFAPLINSLLIPLGTVLLVRFFKGMAK